MSKAHYIYIDADGVNHVTGSRLTALVNNNRGFIESRANFEECIKKDGKIYGFIRHTYTEYDDKGNVLREIPKKEITDIREELGNVPSNNSNRGKKRKDCRPRKTVSRGTVKTSTEK